MHEQLQDVSASADATETCDGPPEPDPPMPPPVVLDPAVVAQLEAEPWNAKGIKSVKTAPTSRAHCLACAAPIMAGSYFFEYRTRQSNQMSDQRRLHVAGECFLRMPSDTRPRDIVFLTRLAGTLPADQAELVQSVLAAAAAAAASE